MRKKKRKGNQPDEKLVFRGIFLSILVILIVLFFPEINAILAIIASLLRYLLGGDFPLNFFNGIFWRGMFVFFSLFICYQIGLLILSQFFLPTSIKDGNRYSLKYFRYFRRKFHREPILLLSGIMKNQNSKNSNLNPTIAFVDLSSALVVEKRNISKSQENFRSKRKKPSNTLSIRVNGPGVNFIDQGEMIQGVADLRPQIRTNPDVVVKTRDGIELRTNVSVEFTVGEEPQELLVTFIDSDHREIKIVGLSDSWSSEGDNGQMVRVISGFNPVDEIDLEDRAEIIHFYERWKSSNYPSIMNMQKEKPVNPFTISPFNFNPDRVSAAVYSKAHANLGKEILHWTELPAFVATNILRDSMSKVKYDDLYLPENPNLYPLQEFKRQYLLNLRNQGVLAYRLVERIDGNVLETGQIWNLAELNLSPSQYFRKSKILRDRGIKVLSADFTQFEPDEVIKKQILEFWKAQWEKQLEIINAENELESQRIISKAKNITQNEMSQMFSKIVEGSDPQSKEILAAQLLKVIEAAVTDPATRKLLPRETINMLWSFRQWLLPLP